MREYATFLNADEGRISGLTRFHIALELTRAADDIDRLSRALAGVSPGTGTEPEAPTKTAGAPDGGVKP